MLNIFSKTIQSDTFFAPEKGIQLYQLVNRNGIEVLITNFGIRLVSLFTPDKNGQLDDIVLGYDTLAEFETKNHFMNTIIGRVANRIENGQFEVDGQTYHVNVNCDQHCLHGGANGLHMQIWEVKSHDEKHIHFYHFSKSGSEGFPGNLEINVLVNLNDDNELKIEYKVTTDHPTPVNLTYHPYFNLSGNANEDIANHLLQIDADFITKTDDTLVPTGKLLAVQNSPLDFKKSKPIGQDIDSENELIKMCGGYDHNFVLNNPNSNGLILAAKLIEPNNKRTLEVWTTQPGLQVYSSNGIDDIGKGNAHYGNHAAVCLEPQHFPNAPNIAGFPSVVVIPDKPYFHQCIYKFGVLT